MVKQVNFAEYSAVIRNLARRGQLPNLNEFRTLLLPKVEPPAGGRIHIVNIPVYHGRPWKQAVRKAGPNTPNGYDIWKVGHLYRASNEKTVVEEIILVNFGKFTPRDQALAWGQSQNLKPKPSRSAFAVGEHSPDLNKKLGMDPMCVVSLEECTFMGHRQFCCVWWGGSGREAYLRWAGRLVRAYDWVAFSRYSLRSPSIISEEFCFPQSKVLCKLYNITNAKKQSALGNV